MEERATNQNHRNITHKNMAVAKRHPLDNAPISQTISLGWASSLIRLGSRKTLEESDMYKNSELEQAERCEAQLSRTLNRDEDISMSKALLSTFFPVLLSQGAFTIPIRLAAGACQILSLKGLLSWIGENAGNDDSTDNQGSLSEGTLWALGFAGGGLIRTLAYNLDFVKGMQVGVRAVGAASMLVFNHSMGLSLNSSASTTTGSIVTLLSNDCRRIQDGFMFLLMSCGTLMEVFVACTFLVLEVKLAAIPGIGLVSLSFPIQMRFATKIGQLQRQSAGLTSERVRKMNELITGVQLVKFNAWEESVAAQVTALRQQEAVILREAELWKAVNFSVFQVVPILSAGVTLLSYVRIYDKDLDAPTAFATLAWFILLRSTLIVLPRGTTYLSEAHSSAARIMAFLQTGGAGDGSSSRSSSRGGRGRGSGGGRAPVGGKSSTSTSITSGSATTTTVRNSVVGIHAPPPEEVILKIANGSFEWTRKPTRPPDDHHVTGPPPPALASPRDPASPPPRRHVPPPSFDLLPRSWSARSFHHPFLTTAAVREAEEAEEVGDEVAPGGGGCGGEVTSPSDVNVQEVLNSTPAESAAVPDAAPSPPPPSPPPTPPTPPPVLCDVSLEVRCGQLVVVCGPIASGKSSLLAAALGEMHEVVMAPPPPPPPPSLASPGAPRHKSWGCETPPSPTSATSSTCTSTTTSTSSSSSSSSSSSFATSNLSSVVAGEGEKSAAQVAMAADRVASGGGEAEAGGLLGVGDLEDEGSTSAVWVGGRVSYVPQQAWILNETVRENITFGLAYDAAWFATVVQACCLEDDVENMAGGELTEIGEGGVTLSGGQKQRVSLARAVYRNADVYLLDDVLSALDAHVALQVFNQVLSRSTGLLKDKAVVMVTHALWCLPEADQVVVMVAGRVAAQGPFHTLQGSGAVNWSRHLGPEEEKDDDDGAGGGGAFPPANASTSSGEQVGGGGMRGGAKPTGLSSVGELNEEEEEDEEEDEEEQEEEGEGKQGEKLPPPPPAPPSAEEVSLRKKGALTATESVVEGGVHGGVYRTYFSAAGGKGLIAQILLLHVVSQLFRVGAEWWTSRWTSDSFGLGQTTYGLGVLAIGLVFGLLVSVRDRLLAFSLLRAGTSLHDDMFKSVLKTGMTFFWTNPSGRVLNRFSKDMDNIDKLLVGQVNDSINFMSLSLSSFVAVLVIVPVSLVPCIPIGLLFVAIARYTLRASRAVKRIESSSRSPVYSLLAECLQGLVSIRTFHAQPRLAREFAEKLDVNSCAVVMYQSITRWLSMRLDAVTALFSFSMSMCVVVFTHFGVGGVSTSATGVALAQTMGMGSMLQFCVRQSTEVASMMTSVERVQEYARLKPEGCRIRPDPSQAATKEEDVEDGGSHDGAPPLDWPQEGCVEFRNVLMRYSGDKKDENGERLKPALKELNFKIQAREKVGVVGRTGAGKSSLAMALFRIVELEEGSILIDDVDVSGLELSRLRSSISIIPQDPLLFRGPLRLNLDPFSRRSDEELWGALEKANLGATVRGMKAGLDSPVSENGGNFSVGQRQLLCLARALLDATKILLLDEATSNVDTHTDELIQRTVRTAFAHCTVVTIAHRLNTIIDSDKVLVMAAGRAKEFDAPARLLADPASRFSKLVDSVGPEGAAELRAQAAGKEETGVGSGKGEEV